MTTSTTVKELKAGQIFRFAVSLNVYELKSIVNNGEKCQMVLLNTKTGKENKSSKFSNDGVWVNCN